MAEMTGPAMAAAKPRRKWLGPVLWLVVPLVLVFQFQTVLLVGLGMLPTAVAYFVDRREEKFAAYCVGGFNVSGVIPFVLELWLRGATTQALSGVAKNPFAWLVMYGAAALGWLAIYWIPQVSMRIRRSRDRAEIARLRKRQEQILEEWGPEVMPDEG